MAILLNCPGCSKQMTIPDGNRGATVRCPACGTLFASVADPYGNPTAYSATPAPRTGPGYVELPAERPDYPRPAPPRPPSDLDRPMDADDPLLLRKSGPDPVTVFALLGGLAMLAVIVLVFFAFIWPGFLRREEGFANAGPHDLLSLAPADSVLLCGLVPGDDMLRGKVLDGMPDAPPIVKELIEDCQRVMLAGEFSKGVPTGIAALLTKKPYDKDKIKTALKLDKERVVNGFAIYPVKIPDFKMADEAYLAMPDPQVLVVGVMPEADFVKCLANQGKTPLVHSDVLARARELETSTLWLMLANRGAINDQLKLVLALAPALAQAKVDAVLQRSKSLSLTVRPANKGYHIELGLDCANRADALKLLDFVSLQWNELKKQNKKGGDDPGAWRDFQQTLAFEQHGTKVIAAADISEKAIQDAKVGDLPNPLK